MFLYVFTMSVDFRTACKLSPPLDRLCGIASHDGVGLHILEITKKESQVRKRKRERGGETVGKLTLVTTDPAPTTAPFPMVRNGKMMQSA